MWCPAASRWLVSDLGVFVQINEPNAMCLSTCTGSEPSARFVLLKVGRQLRLGQSNRVDLILFDASVTFFSPQEVDERGFVWCTNYGSRKAEEIAKNPKAALTFW